MSKFDLTPTEQTIWQEFRYSTKAIIVELLRLREAAASLEPQTTDTSPDIQ